MLKRLYDKSNILFSVLWIVAYCVLMSVGDHLSNILGVEKAVTLPIGAALSVALAVFLIKNRLLEKYGLCRSAVSAKKMLYFLPCALMLSVNLWQGVSLSRSAGETLLYVLTMFSVGFLEEVIFRGLLFNAMSEESPRTAVIVSSVTFGMGHVINLLSGSADLLPTMLQIIYATAAGFMFVMIYVKTRSLIIPIAVHSLFNGLSAFSGEGLHSNEVQIITCTALTLITGGYAAYLALAVKTGKREKK